MSRRQLVITDYRARHTFALSEDGDGIVGMPGSEVLAEHAGVLTLPAREGRESGWAFVDDRGGALVVVRGNASPRRIPVGIPAEHLAGDASGRYAVVTTGVGANPQVWSDVVTVVDLDRDESVRFRTRAGEPGVMVVPDQSDGTPWLLLRHREPGAIEAISLHRCLLAPAHVPRITGTVITDIGDDGHGDVVDEETGIAATATSRGLERFVVDSGTPRAIGIIPWPVAGRPFYLRFDPDTHCAVGIARAGPTSPTAWTEWSNHLVEVNLSTGQTRSLVLPSGLAFRFAIGGSRGAVATIHPDGDTLTLIDRSSPQLHSVLTAPLPAMSRPPLPGRLPWDPIGDSPAQRRAVAVAPDGTTVAVTRGGDSQLHLVSDQRFDTITLPTPLDEGGHLYWHPGLRDLVGR
jgi:hypothetical protein